MANTSNALNHDMTWSARVNKHFSYKGSVSDALLSSYNEEEYDSGDPCKQKGAMGGIAMNIEKLFTVLKSVEKYGDLYINGAINKVANLQAKISSITSAITGILKTLVQRLRNWTLNYLKALVGAALELIMTNFLRTIKDSIVAGIIDQIFCAFENIIKGLFALVGDFLYSLIGQIINTPFCAAEQWVNALVDRLVNDIDAALAPIFDSINDILSGVGEIAGSVYQAIDFILGFQGFLCGTPNCPETTSFKLSPWGGPTKSMQDDFNNFNFGISDSFAGEITDWGDEILNEWFGKGSSNLNQSPGQCYTGTFECGIPQVEIFGGGGSGAIGQAVVNTIGEVVGVNLLSGGEGYESPPFVSIVDPAGCGSDASAFAVLGTDEDGFNNGVVEEIVLNNPGSGYGDDYNGGAPVITSFKGAPNPLVVGNTVNISWNVTNADTVSLGIEGYTNLPLTGSVSIPVTDITFAPNSNSSTVTYTLTATKNNQDSAAQTTTKTFILTVLKDSTSGSQGTTNTNSPVIDSFTASESNVNPGDIVTLSWETTNATSASLNVTGYSSVPLDGSVSIVIPSDIEFPANGSSITNTYTLTATNSNAPEGSQTATQTVSVEIGQASISTTAGDANTGGGSGVDGEGTGTGGAGVDDEGTGGGAGEGGNTSGTGNNDAVAVIGDVDIISTGIGYTGGDDVTVTGGDGAEVEITTNQLGQIVGVNLISGGYGFTRIPTITINSQQGVGARFRPKLKFIPVNEFLLQQELQVIDPNKLVQVVDCVTK